MTEIERKGIEKSKPSLIVTIALVVILAISSVWLFIRVDALQRQVSDLQATDLERINQLNDLQLQVNNLTSEKNSLQSQVNALEGQIDILESAKLIKVHMTYTDNRPLFGTPYIHITGEVVNVGSDTAYNCQLRVILYQGSVVAEDTEILLGTNFGELYISVDDNIYYSGEAITSVSATPSWS